MTWKFWHSWLDFNADRLKMSYIVTRPAVFQAMFEQKTATESSPPPSVPLSKHADYTIPVTEKITERDNDSNEEEHQESLVDPDEKCETEVGFDDEIGLERLRSERKVLEEEVNQMTVEHRKLRQQISDNETNTAEGEKLMTQIKSDLEKVESSNEKRRKLLMKRRPMVGDTGDKVGVGTP